MAVQDLQTYDKFLKEWYLSSWIDQLNSMTTVWKLFRRKVVDYRGRQMLIPIRTSRNTGVGAVANSSGGTVPTLLTAGRQGVENATVTGKIVTGSISVAQDVIDQSANDRGAFYEVVDFEMRGLVQDMAEDLDRQMCGDGSGALARVNSDQGGSTGTVLVDVSSHYPFFTGMSVDLWSAAGTPLLLNNPTTARTIDSIVRNTDGSGLLTLNAAVGSALEADGFISRSGVRTTAVNACNEMMGIDGAINEDDPLDGDYLGIDRGTGGEYWRSYQFQTADILTAGGSGDALTEENIQSAFDATHDQSNGDVNCMLMHRRTRAALYAAMNSNQQRFVDTNVIQPGFLSGKMEDHHPDGQGWLFWDGRIPIVVDKYAKIDVSSSTQATFRDAQQAGYIYGLDLSSIYMGMITDFKWWAPEGQILHRADSRSFAIIADMYIYGDLVCDAPAKSFQVSGYIG